MPTLPVTYFGHVCLMKVIPGLILYVLIPLYSLSQDNPVIIELFTSQGCSSCPAADKNLSEIIKRAEAQGKPVYGLSFHVDYWNYIGWKDPYSSKEFTERQRRYAKTLNLTSIYTPQMIVNGKDEFVGSNKDEAHRIIDKSFRMIPVFQIVIESSQVSNGILHIKYSVNEKPAGEVLNMAIVEKETENFVPAGENSGRKLQHDNVVRIFRTVLLQSKGEVEIKIEDLNLSKCSLILYVQDKQFHVLGSRAKFIL